MKPIVCLIGKSGAGKDHLSKIIYQSDKTAVSVIQYTTRPKRDSEVQGKDVWCVSKDEFNRLFDERQIFEKRSYNVLVNGEPDVWYYGTPTFKELPKDKHYVLVATIDIILEASKIADNIEVIYIDTSDEIREYRAKNIRKSFDKSEWDRRVKADAIDFSEDRIHQLEDAIGRPIHYFNNNKEDTDFLQVYYSILER